MRNKTSHAGYIRLTAILLASICLARPLHAYVDLAPTLSRIIIDSQSIALVQVVGFDSQKHQVILSQVRVLKGQLPSTQIVHDISAARAATLTRQIERWATPGARGVMFGSRTTSLVCMGEGWYAVRSTGNGLWKLAPDRPDLPLAYHGTVSRLAESVERMLAGKDAILTVVAFGADNEGASFDLALNRQNLPGMARVQRIRANLKMPSTVISASANPAYFIGVGPVDESDIPALIQKLKSDDAMMRAEAADDLRTLNHKAIDAVEPLSELLKDPAAAVRFSAAAAMIRIAHHNDAALEVLRQGLSSDELAQRRQAARCAGLAGAGASPLVPRLAELLKDPDQPMRIAALQSISMLGGSAGAAAQYVIPLLDDPDLSIDAADALGRMGPAASAALTRLKVMLSSEDPATQWAAVRAMSQIGGPDAHAAVDYIIKALPRATEVEGYNMMIYLSLLGPVASDAATTVRNTPIKNPVLPSATLWAMAPDKSFPGLGGGEFGGRGGGGGGPGGADMATLIYQAYVHELGDRLRPAAGPLARKIMDGTAGDVPSWGYEILACGPDDALQVLVPHLADQDILMRERAVVAIGFMNSAGAAAKTPLAAALNNAQTQREKRLIEWCLREIEPG